MLIEFELCTIFRPRESTKSGGGWLDELAGAYVIVNQSHLEPGIHVIVAHGSGL